MESIPCKPFPRQKVPLRFSARVSEISLPFHSNQFPFLTAAGGSACNSEYSHPTKAPEIAQRTAMAVLVGHLERRSVQLAAFNQGQPLYAVHQGGSAAPSCRLCLIACNSRQFDELGSSCDR